MSGPHGSRPLQQQPRSDTTPQQRDIISPATQVAGAALSPRTVGRSSTASKRKAAKDGPHSTHTPEPSLAATAAAAGAREGRSHPAAYSPADADPPPPPPATLRSSRIKRRRNKSGGRNTAALEFGDDAPAGGQHPNPLTGPSGFELMRQQFDEASPTPNRGKSVAATPAAAASEGGAGVGDVMDDATLEFFGIRRDDRDEGAANVTDLSSGGAASTTMAARSLIAHPRTLLLVIAIVPMLLLLGTACAFIRTAAESHRLASDTDAIRVTERMLNFAEALGAEIWAAGQLQLFATTTPGSRTPQVPITDLRASSYVDAKRAFSFAVDTSTDALTELVIEWAGQSEAIAARTSGAPLSPDGISVARLERIRASVARGQFFDVTVGEYHDMLHGVASFTFSQLLRRVALVERDVDVVRAVCLKQQATLLRLFARLISSSSSSSAGGDGGEGDESDGHNTADEDPNDDGNNDAIAGGASLALPTRRHLELAWRIIGTYDACSWSSALPAVHAPRVWQAGAEFPLEYRAAVSRIVADAVVARGTFTWNATAAAELRRAQLRAIREAGQHHLRRTTQLFGADSQRVEMRATFALITTLIVLCVFGLLCSFAQLVSHATSARSEAQQAKEVRGLERAITRMQAFVQHLLALDVAWMAGFTRRVGSKALRIRTQNEENSLYQLCSHVRDVATYLPTTVLHPPRGTPPSALTRSGLLLRPSLHTLPDLVIVRVSLSTFHQQFSGNGSRQKGLQHQVIRLLSRMQEMATKVDKHAFVHSYGDHALLWLNLVRQVDYPCWEAVMLVAELSKDIASFGIAPPCIAICAGAGIVGHVSNAGPQHAISFADASRSSASLVAPFSVFGPVADELVLLDNVAQLHEVEIVANDKAAKAFFNERGMRGNDAFAGAPFAGGAGGGGGLSSPSSPGNSVPRTQRQQRQQHVITFLPIEILKLPSEGAQQQREQQQQQQQEGPASAALAGEQDEVEMTATYEFNADLAEIHDYTATLHDGSSLAPCFHITCRVAGDDREEQLLETQRREAAWVSAFDAFFDAVRNPNTTNVSVATEKIAAFAEAHGASPTNERLLRLLRAAGQTSLRGTDLPSIRRERLHTNLSGVGL